MARAKAKVVAERHQQPDGKWISVPVHWEAPERIPIMYADQIFVTMQGSQFLVSFGQAHGPYEVSPSQETLERLGKEGMAIQPVARLAIPGDRVEAIIGALSQVYRVWQQRHGK